MDDQRMQRLERRDGALLRKVGDVIAAEPERYEQGYWAKRSEACGTVCCLAGHTVSLLPGFEEFRYAVGSVFADEAYVNGEAHDIEAFAAETLGLAHDEWHLFSGNWQPAGDDPDTPLHERVRDALYALADGATVEEVTA